MAIGLGSRLADGGGPTRTASAQIGAPASHSPPRLRIGHPDAPDKVFAVVGQARHWILSADLYVRCGHAWADIAAFDPEDARLPEAAPLHRAKEVLGVTRLVGDGIEVGALSNPSLFSSRARMRYVDYIPSEQARIQYSHLPGIVDVDVVDDGERLDSFDDESLDFIVANHFLEHTENPIGTIRNHARKLRPGGVLVYAIPDKRFTFDRDRPITPFDHVLMDDVHGVDVSRLSHFLEFARHVGGHRTKADIEACAKTLMDGNHHPHFHVWDAASAREFFERTSDVLNNRVRLDVFAEDGDENVALLVRS